MEASQGRLRALCPLGSRIDVEFPQDLPYVLVEQDTLGNVYTRWHWQSHGCVDGQRRTPAASRSRPSRRLADEPRSVRGRPRASDQQATSANKIVTLPDDRLLHLSIGRRHSAFDKCEASRRPRSCPRISCRAGPQQPAMRVRTHRSWSSHPRPGPTDRHLPGRRTRLACRRAV